MLTAPIVLTAPRSSRSHCPSPCADQRVASEPSTELAATLPSSALTVAETTARRVGEAPKAATEPSTARAVAAARMDLLQAYRNVDWGPNRRTRTRCRTVWVLDMM